MTSLHRDSVERGGGGLRVVDWYLSLNFGQKIVVGVLSAVSVFLASYFAAVAFLSSAPSDRNSPQAGASAPSITSPEASSATPSPEPPDIRLNITSARWEGEKHWWTGAGRGMSPQCTVISFKEAARDASRTGGTARWGRRWTGRVRPSPRTS
jgi:hypothetical protein